LIDEFSNEASWLEQLLVGQRIHPEIALSQTVSAARAVFERLSQRRETVTKQD
jgi:hypothetical protein